MWYAEVAQVKSTQWLKSTYREIQGGFGSQIFNVYRPIAITQTRIVHIFLKVGTVCDHITADILQTFKVKESKVKVTVYARSREQIGWRTSPNLVWASLLRHRTTVRDVRRTEMDKISWTLQCSERTTTRNFDTKIPNFPGNDLRLNGRDEKCTILRPTALDSRAFSFSPKPNVLATLLAIWQTLEYCVWSLLVSLQKNLVKTSKTTHFIQVTADKHLKSAAHAPSFPPMAVNRWQMDREVEFGSRRFVLKMDVGWKSKTVDVINSSGRK